MASQQVTFQGQVRSRARPAHRNQVGMLAQQQGDLAIAAATDFIDQPQLKVQALRVVDRSQQVGMDHSRLRFSLEGCRHGGTCVPGPTKVKSKSAGANYAAPR